MMKKREFIKKTGILSVSMLAVPSLGFGGKSTKIIGPSVAEEILTNYLNARFSTEEQFRRRVRKLDQFDMVPPEY
jgi:hypothetical protein